MRAGLNSLLLRGLVSVAFAALALWGVGFTRVADELAGAEAGWLLLALAALTVSYSIGAVRWWLLLRGEHLDVELAHAVRHTWVGLFFTNALPSGFGGDAVRAWSLGREVGSVPTVAATVLVDRLAGVWALMTLGLIGVAADGGSLPGGVVVSLLLVCALVLGGSAALFVDAPARLLVRLTARVPRLARAIAGMSARLVGLRRRPGQVLVAVAISLGSQVFVAIAAWLLARSLGIHVSLILLAATIPVALLATAAPVSINGLGVREAVFRALLMPAGVAAHDAIAFSITTVVAGAVVSLPGGIVWALGRRRQSAVVALASSPS